MSVGCETSEQMDKFLHRGAEDAAGGNHMRVFLNGCIYRFQLGRSCSLQHGTAATEWRRSAANTAAAVSVVRTDIPTVQSLADPPVRAAPGGNHNETSSNSCSETNGPIST